MCIQTADLNPSRKEIHKIIPYNFTAVGPTYLVDNGHVLTYHSQIKKQINDKFDNKIP